MDDLDLELVTAVDEVFIVSIQLFLVSSTECPDGIETGESDVIYADTSVVCKRIIGV